MRRDDQKRAGDLLSLSDSLVPSELITVILDSGTLQGLEGDDHKLSSGLGLELRELTFESGLGRRIENSGVFDDAAGELRKGQRMGRARHQG
jgi:hypothetical protein